jgi:hypothetical protein
VATRSVGSFCQGGTFSPLCNGASLPYRSSMTRIHAKLVVAWQRPLASVADAVALFDNYAD